LVLIIGIGFLLVGFNVLSNEYEWFGSQLLNNPNAMVPGCNPIYGTGCVYWPFVDLALCVVGLIATMAGAIGLLESHFPRADD